MRTDIYYESCGAGNLRAGIWTPKGEIKAIVQILHGIAEHIERYEVFARFLNERGVLVVAADHMGHGKSVGSEGIKGYFHGGWFAAVEDAHKLMTDTMNQYPGIPYVLFGHSMGSFMARTILAKYPEAALTGAIICGTGWQSSALLKVAIPMCNLFCKKDGEKNPSPAMQKIMFGSYNNKVEHVRTENDWLSRDNRVVDAYNADPLCGFTATAGLYRDMLKGISYIQEPGSLNAMNKELPVFFIAGSDDPVGGYGKTVKQTEQAFIAAGMRDVSCKLYPMCRHEILNEINREEVFRDIWNWIAGNCFN